MSGLSETCSGYPWKTSGLGQRRILQGMMDMITLCGIRVSTSRGTYCSSWGIACGESIVASNRTK